MASLGELPQATLWMLSYVSGGTNQSSGTYSVSGTSITFDTTCGALGQDDGSYCTFVGR